MGEGAPTPRIGGTASRTASWSPGDHRAHLQSSWKPLSPPTLKLELKETKNRFLLACDYSDLMWEVKAPGTEKIVAYVCAYYLCMHHDAGYGAEK